MRLILSSLQKYDLATEKQLKLYGPWCLQKTTAPITFEELAYYKHPQRPLPSTSREGSLAITEALDALLPVLTVALNNYHGRSYSQRFWEILLRHTITNMLVPLYDRYERMQEILKSGESYEAEVLPQGVKVKLSSRYSGFLWSEQPTFNHLIGSELLWFLNPKNVKLSILQSKEPLEIVYHDNTSTLAKVDVSLSEKIRSVRKLVVAQVARLIRLRFLYKGVNVRGVQGMSPRDNLKLLLALEKISKGVSRGKKIKKVPRVEKTSAHVDLKLNTSNVFIQFAAKIIPQLLPTLVIDGFEKWEAAGFAELNSRVKVCVFGPNFADKWNERMELAMYKELCGAYIIGSQHGTGYGTFRYCPDPFQTEYKIFDEFLTWGWSEHERFSFRATPMPAPIFNPIQNTHCARNEDIVLIGTLATAGVYFGLPVAHSEECYAYFESKLTFLNGLKKNHVENILYRPYLAGTLFVDEVRFVEQRFPKMRMLYSLLWPAMQSCKLAILDHPGTTWHIVASMNTPFIIYCDPHLWEQSKDMDPFLERFRKVGIWHDSPESAAQQVNKIGDRVQEWWQSAEVQEARNYFLKYHARHSAHWFDEWAQLIHQRVSKNS